MQQPFRIRPALPAAEMKTYRIYSPADVTVRTACEQAGCEAWRRGWETHVDEATDLGRRQALYIRAEAGRAFTERRTGAGITVFRFESGQRCFADHRTRPQRFIEQGGDWRGNPTREHRVHARPADWVESFAGHQDRIADLIRRG